MGALYRSTIGLDLSLATAGEGVGAWITEASTVGLRPGEWPQRIVATDGIGIFSLDVAQVEEEEHETRAVHYRGIDHTAASPRALHLIIFNT